MRQRQLAIFLLLSLLLSGCMLRATAETSAPPEGAFALYYAVAEDAPGGKAIDFEYRIPPAGVDIIPGLVALLLEGPVSGQLKAPFQGKNISILSYQQEGDALTLDLSEAYGNLTGIDLTIASYCFALTLCQVEGVASVCLTVEGRPLPPVLSCQQLRAEDVILSGTEETPVVLDAVLWFARADGGGLGTEPASLVKTEDETAARVVLDALLRGPTDAALTPLLPAGTAVLSARVEKRVCYVDFSAPFRDGIPADPAQAALLFRSVVNTLTGSLENVASVQLRVEGAPLPIFDALSFDTQLTTP